MCYILQWYYFVLHEDELVQRLELDTSEPMTELTKLKIFVAAHLLSGKMFELIK